MHREQFGVGTVLDGALAVTVDKNGALFGLLGGVATYIDQGLDYVVEGMDIVVPQDECAAAIIQGVDIFVGLRVYVWFLLTHKTILSMPLLVH